MTKLGPVVGRTCGFSPKLSDVICGEPASLHGWFMNDENNDYGYACEKHAPMLAKLADVHHPTQDDCFAEDGWWLTRPDGSSFCFRPDADAELQAELALGATAHRLVGASL